jgi:hypothetical protein
MKTQRNGSLTIFVLCHYLFLRGMGTSYTQVIIRVVSHLDSDFQPIGALQNSGWLSDSVEKKIFRNLHLKIFSNLKYVFSLWTILRYSKFASDNLLQKKKSYVKSAILQQEYDVIYSRLIVLGENVSGQNDSVDKTYRRT